MTATLPLPLVLPPKKARPGIPEDFAPSVGSLRWARDKGYDRLDLAYETERFVLHHLGHESRWKDWQRAWQSWVTRSAHDKASSLNIGRPSPSWASPTPAQVDERGFLRRDDEQG